ncbi:MAG: cell division protein ZapE [Steroidobacteraceae bacterium]
MPTPLLARELERRGYVPDAAQLAAIARLEDLRLRLVAAERADRKPLARVRRLLRPPRAATERGVYLWGGVGRGKTLLMDAFHASLPFEGKRRRHFHRFMHDVHAQLKTLAHTESPLTVVADRFADGLRVLCLDELHVNDIADAMILARLFSALLDRGVTLVFTSNVPPKGLYRDGLQRKRFLPAIAMLEKHTEVIAVDAGVDYRLRELAKASLYIDSRSPDAPAAMTRLFEFFADGPGTAGGHIEVSGREIPVLRASDNAVWFDFMALCEGPRSQDDYIEIAGAYPAVLLSNVPVLDETRDNAARRFIALIDELYDRGVDLAVSAAAPPERLYRGTRLAFEFQRTSSRLAEMQTGQYLARTHG